MVVVFTMIVFNDFVVIFTAVTTEFGAASLLRLFLKDEWISKCMAEVIDR